MGGNAHFVNGTWRSTGNVGIGTTAPWGLLQVGTSPNAPLVVLASGNVGIGTTAPGQKLEVAGHVAIATSKKVILDSDDNSDTHIVHNAAGNYLSIYVDNVEVARGRSRDGWPVAGEPITGRRLTVYRVPLTGKY